MRCTAPLHSSPLRANPPQKQHNVNHWHLITRLGEAPILFPLILVLGIRLAQEAMDPKAIARWGAVQAGVIGLTVLSKLAFIGWGLGVPALNFTGLSGHAMLSASAYPLMAQQLMATRTSRPRQLAVWAGVALALLIAVSRVEVGAHSVSEVVAGLAAGLWASAEALRVRSVGKADLTIPLVAISWIIYMASVAPVAHTHAMVTRMALALSGHARPYTREQMLREYHLRQMPKAAPTLAVQFLRAASA